MTVLDIVKFPHDALATRARSVDAWDGELERLVRDMEETMHAARGVGLAANQVGLPLALAIIDVDPGGEASRLWVLTNPRIVETEGVVREEEGCLSIPGLGAPVDRPARVVAEFQDLHGEPQRIEGTGLMARALCHEIDHLNGILYPQRIAGMRGEMFRRKVRKAWRSGTWEDVRP